MDVLPAATPLRKNDYTLHKKPLADNSFSDKGESSWHIHARMWTGLILCSHQSCCEFMSTAAMSGSEDSIPQQLSQPSDLDILVHFLPRLLQYFRSPGGRENAVWYRNPAQDWTLSHHLFSARFKNIFKAGGRTKQKVPEIPESFKPFPENEAKDILSWVLRNIFLRDKLPVIKLNFK